jgi:hypothetical protein
MAPDVAGVDADRDLNLGLSARDFYDEVLRRLLHGKQSLSDPEDLLILFMRTNLLNFRGLDFTKRILRVPTSRADRGSGAQCG